MKIAVKTTAIGFNALLKTDGQKNEITEKISVNDPAIGRKMKAVKAHIQHLISDACGIPSKIRNSRNRITDCFNAVCTSPDRALTALTAVRDHGLLSLDFGPEIATFKSSQEYRDFEERARKAGAQIRIGAAGVKITVWLRPEEDSFFFGSFPQDIIQHVDVRRDIPLDVMPIFKAAALVSSYENSMYAAMEGRSNTVQKNLLSKGKKVLEDDLDKVLRGVFPETQDGKDAMVNFESALRADIKVIDDTMNGQGYYLRTYIEKLVKDESFIDRCGMTVFTQRLMGSTTMPVMAAANDDDIEVDVDDI